jgi:hypothetical protein
MKYELICCSASGIISGGNGGRVGSDSVMSSNISEIFCDNRASVQFVFEQGIRAVRLLREGYCFDMARPPYTRSGSPRWQSLKHASHNSRLMHPHVKSIQHPHIFQNLSREYGCRVYSNRRGSFWEVNVEMNTLL